MGSFNPETHWVVELIMLDFKISGIHLDKKSIKEQWILLLKSWIWVEHFFMGNNFSKIDKQFFAQHFCQNFIFDRDSVIIDGLHAEVLEVLCKELLAQFFFIPMLANWNVQKAAQQQKTYDEVSGICFFTGLPREH